MKPLKKISRSVVLPLLLLVYLAAMAYVGRENLTGEGRWQYFATLAVSLLVIVALFFALRRKEKLRKQREQDQYGTYSPDNKTDL